MTDLVAAQRVQGGELAQSAPGQDPLGELVAAWLLTLRSEHSRLAYATDLGLRYEHDGGGYRLGRRGDVNGWLDHLDSLGVPVLAADEVHVNLWRDRLVEAGYAPATIGRRLTTVSSLYRYLVRRRVLSANPAEFATRAKVDRSRVATFSPHPTELGTILAAADGRDLRSSALVRVMTLTGVRVSEAVDADVEDLRTDGTRTSLKVTRKGGRVVEVPVPDDAAGVLRVPSRVRNRGPVVRSPT